jgi:DNA-binding CsgD family transcriptional regulator
VRTVEAHLSHVYRKLGVRRRAELARHLASAERNAKTAGHAPKVQ